MSFVNSVRAKAVNITNRSKERVQQFAEKNLFWLDWSANSVYTALVAYIYLCMFHTPFVFRILIPLSTMIKRLGIQSIMTLLLSAGPIVYEYFVPYFEDMAIYPMVLVPLLIFVEVRKITEGNFKNHLRLLILGLIAQTIVDVSLKMPFYLFYCTFYESYFPTAMCRIFSFYIIIQLIWVINLFINRWKVSALIGFNTMFLLAAVNYWTLAITNKEFMFSDIYLAKTAGKVITGVQLRTEDILYFLLYVAMVVLFNICVIKINWKKTKFKERVKRAVLAEVYLFLMLNILVSGAIDTTYKPYAKLGLISSLFTGIDMESEPTGYKEYLNELEIKDTFDSDLVKEDIQEKVNVILIMNEAFSDLSVIGEFDVTEDPIPFTRKLMENYPSGHLYASAFGNNTATSEYESLTGIPTGITKTGGKIYQSFMEEKEYSLVQYFKDLGYKTLGMHPYDGEGYNRRNAWKAFGFDEMMFVNEFDKTESIRGYLSDEAFYDHIIKKFDEKGENPLFLFGITMQNHATYLTDMETDIIAEGMDYPELNEYLSLLKITDESNKKLIEHFEKEEEKTMIIFFGDHQPMIPSEFYEEVMGIDFHEVTGEKQSLIYKIPYFIWTNYEAEYTVPEEISTNYLSKVIIDALGYPRTDWYEFMDTVMKEYPVITLNFVKINGEYVNTKDVKSVLEKKTVPNKDDPYYLLKLYQSIAYERGIVVHKEE